MSNTVHFQPVSGALADSFEDEAASLKDEAVSPKWEAESLKVEAVNRLRPFIEISQKEAAIPDAARSVVAGLDLPGADGFQSGATSPVDFCEAAEALAWGDPAICYSWLVSRQVAWIIAECGTPEQKKKWLPQFASDPLLPASLYLQEGPGTSLDELSTTVVADGAGSRINGYKSPVFHADNAKVGVVVSRDENGALCAALVEGAPPEIVFEGLNHAPSALAACRPASAAWIRDLHVAEDAKLDGGDLARAVTVCRLAHASVCVGVAAAATRYAGEWAQRRVAFGKPIIGFQGVAFPLVNLVLEADAVRLGVQDLVSPQHESKSLARKTDDVMARANRLIEDASRISVQTMGVHGITSDHPTPTWYKVAPALASVDFNPRNSPLLPA
jgi:alkylation response protein AidB-like acyl-CoA dehydrogenase